jgi:Histidine kinase-like ATPase domain
MTLMFSSSVGVAGQEQAVTRRSSLELAVAPSAVRTARHWTAALLTQANAAVDQEIIDSVVLLVSEMVTNAIRAVCDPVFRQSTAAAMPSIRQLSKPRVWLAIARSPEMVRIEVHDSAMPISAADAREPAGHRDPVAGRRGAEPDSEEESGRGLDVIAALAVDWGWHPDQFGKVVWCELSVQ